MAEPNLKEVMRMAEEMRKSMKEAHDDLSRSQYEGEAGAGLVKAIVNGRHEVIRIKYQDNIKEESLEVIADLTAAAVNAANREVEKASEKKMMDLTKKLNLPGSKEVKDNE